MNNSVNGNTTQNVRNHLDFEFVNTPERFQKCVNGPNYRDSHIITENLVGVKKLPNNKVKQADLYGYVNLDCSKVHMYPSYYDALQPEYDNSTKLAYTNTDSYMLKIDTDDVYEDLPDIDFNGYHPSHPNYDKTNKKVPGLFVDELNGRIITRFIGLKPK